MCRGCVASINTQSKLVLILLMILDLKGYIVFSCYFGATDFNLAIIKLWLILIILFSNSLIVFKSSLLFLQFTNFCMLLS